jgi:AraC-like DNA-binding protein
MSRTRQTVADEPFFLVRSVAATLADGAVLGTHRHHWGQLIYAVSGLLTVRTEHGMWVVPPHWAVWAPRAIAHGVEVTGRAHLRTLYFRPTLEGQPPSSTVVAVSALLRELITRACDIGMLDERQSLHTAMTVLILHELRTRPTAPLELAFPRTAPLRAVAEFVADPARARESHAALARRFGVSVRTLERGFSAETGLSLGRWRRQAAFLHALRQLGSGASVKNVAAGTGYRSASAFVAAFRAALGTTPGRYYETAAHRSPGSFSA